MRLAAVPTWDGGGVLRPLAGDGEPAGPDVAVADLAAAAGERERAEAPRWVWPDTAAVYPALLRAGVRIARCDDLALTEALLLGHEGRWGEPRGLAAARARALGLPVPADPPPRVRGRQAALFDPDVVALEDAEGPDAISLVKGAQQRRLAAAEHPGRLRLLVAAESAGALAAAEMGHDGLPWSAQRHDALLTELLGPRPAVGELPRRLVALAAEVSAAFGGRRVNPDAPAEVVRAFGLAGVPVRSARSHVLRGVAHPAVAPLLAYKELSRLFAAHGWAWLDDWVSDGRFRPEYVPGGVVSGRWASRGGGALQLPRAIRGAVVADPGWTLVVADAAQLEPRVLAALADDRRLARAASAGDLYAALAVDAFDGDRARAKVGMLGAIYGQTSGEGGRLQAVLRHRFPDAIGLVEAAARDGEEGRIVRSRLGRTSPPPSVSWWGDAAAGGEEAVAGEAPDGGDAEEGEAAHRRRDAVARSRGRFTRNFVVQASAADWALVLLATLRRRLAAPALAGARLVFFQHDEVVVHCPREQADGVVAALAEAGDEARVLVFADTPVRFPLQVAVVDCYADAK